MTRGTRFTLGVIAALLALPAAANATWPGENGDIIFVSGRGAGGDGSADIYTLPGPSGLVSQPLTPNLTGQHRHPNISPDGRMLAFALGNGAERDIWTVPYKATGASIFRDTDSQSEDRPAWSPDGKWIAYESEEPPNCPAPEQPCDQFDVYVSEADNPSNTFNLTAGTPTTNQGKPFWSPDGTKIYYQTDQLGDLDIFYEESDGSQGVPSSLLISATNEYQASLSGDGKSMCFTRGGPLGSPDTEVYLLSPVSPGGTQTNISDNDVAMDQPQHGDYNCAISPDGEYVAFTQGTFGNGKLVYEDSDDADSVNGASPVTPDVMGVFDGNVEWARVPLKCQGKRADIVGTAFDDKLKGTPDKDVIVALGGADKVSAKAGNDLVCGNGGPDKLKGSDGNDEMYGAAGADLLSGGNGTDFCNGGPDVDTFKKCEQAIQ